MRVVILSLLLSSVACAACKPSCDCGKASCRDSDPCCPAPPPEKHPEDKTPPRNGAPDRSPSNGPQPVDPTPH